MTTRDPLLDARQLYHHISDSDASMVKLRLEAGVDPSLVFPEDRGGKTPLYLAASHGKTDICRVLLAAGANVHWLDSLEQTALHAVGLSTHWFATAGKREEAARVLLQHGADPNGFSVLSQTPLHCAIDVRDGTKSRMNSVPLVRVLLQHGANASIVPEEADRSYLTPFQLAVKSGHLEMVKCFLEHSHQDPLQKTLSGRSLVQLCSAKQLELKEFVRNLALSLHTEHAVMDAIPSQAQESAPEGKRAHPMPCL